MEKKKCPACGRESTGIKNKEDLINSIIGELREAASRMNNSENTTGINENKVNIGKVRAYIKVLRMLGCKVEMESQYVIKTASYGHVDEIKVDGKPLEIEHPTQWRNGLPH